MLKRLRHFARRPHGTWLGQLLLACLFLRALIPQGFMPDFGASADDAFKMVICSASGSKVIAFDADGGPADAPQLAHHDQPCVFSGLCPFALNTVAANELPAPIFVVIAHPQPSRFLLPPARAGPLLGSRAPPLHA
jgi:hypothetical protein